MAIFKMHVAWECVENGKWKAGNIGLLDPTNRWNTYQKGMCKVYTSWQVGASQPSGVKGPIFLCDRHCFYLSPHINCCTLYGPRSWPRALRSGFVAFQSFVYSGATLYCYHNQEYTVSERSLSLSRRPKSRHSSQMVVSHIRDRQDKKHDVTVCSQHPSSNRGWQWRQQKRKLKRLICSNVELVHSLLVIAFTFLTMTNYSH